MNARLRAEDVAHEKKREKKRFKEDFSSLSTVENDARLRSRLSAGNETRRWEERREG